MGDCLATIHRGRKVVGLLCALFMGVWVPIYHNVAWAEAYLQTKWHLDPPNLPKVVMQCCFE